MDEGQCREDEEYEEEKEREEEREEKKRRRGRGGGVVIVAVVEEDGASGSSITYWYLSNQGQKLPGWESRADVLELPAPAAPRIPRPSWLLRYGREELPCENAGRCWHEGHNCYLTESTFSPVSPFTLPLNLACW